MKKKSVKSKRPKMKAKFKRKRKMALNITKTLLKNELINKSGELQDKSLLNPKNIMKLSRNGRKQKSFFLNKKKPVSSLNTRETFSSLNMGEKK